jgi:hypothetical protein
LRNDRGRVLQLGRFGLANGDGGHDLVVLFIGSQALANDPKPELVG